MKVIKHKIIQLEFYDFFHQLTLTYRFFYIPEAGSLSGIEIAKNQFYTSMIWPENMYD